MGIMLVYDITNEKTFENIKNWIRNIEENASADVEKMLLGNKCELNEKRQVCSLFQNVWLVYNCDISVELHQLTVLLKFYV